MLVHCIVCGKKIEAQKTTKKYCSNSCMNKARRERYHDNQQSGKTSFKEKQCLLCGEKFTPKSAAANLRTCCYNCMPDGIQLTRGGFLAKLKQRMGGKCVKCGYKNCLQALEFHHLDPSQKDFTISNCDLRLAEAIEESKKCILICSNCHKEFHAGLWTIDDINFIN